MADNINSARTRGFSRIEFAKTLLRTQQLDRAETVLQEAQVIAEEIQNAEHFQYVKYVFALYFLRLQRLDEALKCIQAAAQITTHWLDFEIALLQGILLARLSDTAAARQTFERAIAFIGQISPEYFYVDYAYSLAYSGLACISPMEPSALIQKARSALERAIHKCAPLGSVGDVAWLLSELMPLDHDGILVPLQQRLATVNPRDE